MKYHFFLFYFFLLLLGVIVGGMPTQLSATDNPSSANEAQSLPVAAPDKPIAFLSNEELLNQFSTAKDEIKNRLLAHLRLVSEQAVLLSEHAQHQTLALPRREDANTVVPANQDSTQATSQQALDQAKQQVEQLNAELVYKEKEKVILEQYHKQINATQTELNTLLQQFDKLEQYARQIALRLADGSLVAKEVPNSLKADVVQSLRQEIVAKQQTLVQTSTQIQDHLATLITQLDSIKAQVLQAQTTYETAKERHANVLKQQDLEKKYISKSPQQLLSELNSLGNELVWLEKSFQTTYRAFQRADTQQMLLDKKIQALSPPDTTQLQHLDPNQIEQAAQLFDQIKAYHQTHLTLVSQQSELLQALIKQGEALIGENAVVTAHLFTMETISRVLEEWIKQEKISASDIAESLRLTALNEINQRVNQIVAEVSSAVKKAHQQLEQQKQIQTEAQAAISQADQRLENIRQAYKAMQETQQWEEKLKKMSITDIIKEFQTVSEKIQTQRTILAEQESAYKTAQQEVEKAQQALSGLKDPMLREIIEKAPDDLAHIRENLFQFAGLEIAQALENPSEKMQQSAPPAVVAQAPDQTASVSHAQETPSEKENPLPPLALLQNKMITYQNQLASYLQVNAEINAQNTVLLEKLGHLNQQIEAYHVSLDTGYSLAQQYHACAIELKKRVGQKELGEITIPEGINEALQPASIEKLKQQREELFNHHIDVKQNLNRITEELGKDPQKIELFTAIRILTGKRLDSLSQAQKLEDNFVRARENHSQTEQKILEQAARRRINMENTPVEFVLFLFHSQELDNLNNILQEYYLNLSELEDKIANLEKQKKQHDKGVGYANEEKNKISDLLPLLEEKLQALKQQYLLRETLLKARIAPEKAKELATAYTAESGNNLTIPVPINQEARAAYIEKQSLELYELQTQRQSLEKWKALFDTRLASGGVDDEIGIYQDSIGNLEAKKSALQRQSEKIIGHPPQALATLSEEEKPITQLENLRFLNGEVGVLRADRLRLYQELLYLMAIQLASIILIVIFVNFLIGVSFGRAVRKNQKLIEQGDLSRHSSLAAQLLLRKVFKFGVWTLGFIFCLEIIGFNVGAILAGLGIGGLAIAMAAKNVLADIIGGITVMLMGLYKIGDMIEHQGKMYIVRGIGLRYTLLEDFSYNYKVNTPNSLLSESEIIMVSAHPGYTVLTNINLSTDNPADHITLAVQLIEQVITAHPGARFIWAKHDHFDDYSFVIRMHYDILKFKDRAIVESVINAEIVKQFQAHNIQLTPIKRIANINV